MIKIIRYGFKKAQRLMGASLLSSSDDQQTEKQLKIQTMHII